MSLNIEKLTFITLSQYPNWGTGYFEKFKNYVIVALKQFSLNFQCGNEWVLFFFYQLVRSSVAILIKSHVAFQTLAGIFQKYINVHFSYKIGFQYLCLFYLENNDIFMLKSIGRTRKLWHIILTELSLPNFSIKDKKLHTLLNSCLNGATHTI